MLHIVPYMSLPDLQNLMGRTVESLLHFNVDSESINFICLLIYLSFYQIDILIDGESPSVIHKNSILPGKIQLKSFRSMS